MLTDIPPALLHRVRDGAAYVHDLAQLGLALLCPCDDDHGAGARWLMGDGTGEALPPLPESAYPPGAVELPGLGDGMAERCYRPGCSGWVTGASDYCSPQCEWQATGTKRCPQCAAKMDPNQAWWWTDRGACCTEGCARDLLAVPA